MSTSLATISQCRTSRRGRIHSASTRGLAARGSPDAVFRTLAGLAPAQRLAAVNRLITLLHRRWAIPVLAEFHAKGGGAGKPIYTGGGGARFITLIKRLRLGRDSLTATLDHLIEHDYLMRNPGYGHPMRPEYLLAEDGYAIVAACMRLMKTLRTMDIEGVTLKKWSLPVLFALGCSLDRFGELKSTMPRITARALTLTLKDLARAELVVREVTAGYPPGSRYRLTRRSRRLLTLIAELSCLKA